MFFNSLIQLMSRGCPVLSMTLLHNHFESDGGTATDMTVQELEAALRRSMNYWRDKALLA